MAWEEVKRVCAEKYGWGPRDVEQLTLRDIETYTADIKDIQSKVEFDTVVAAAAHNKRIDEAHEKAVDNLMRGLPWWYKGD